MDACAGRCVYSDAVRAVVWHYVDPVSYRRLVVAGLRSVRAALDNPAFRNQFEAARDEARRARFAEVLDVLILKARAADPWFAFQAADWLAVTLEKNRAILGLPDGAIVSEFLFGAMDDLDPYTRFVTPAMRRMEDEQTMYAGIGVAVAERDGRFLVVRVFDGGAAECAGLAAGDEILAVDGENVRGLPLKDLVGRLRGKAGTRVVLCIRPDTEDIGRNITIVRRMIYVPPVQGTQMIDPERGIAYVRLVRFADGMERDLRRDLRGLADQGARALVLDLRDNPGGTLLAALEVAGVFLPRGCVARTRGRALGASWTYDVPLFARRVWHGPVAVLVNENTASASEIVASALASRGGAILVGRPTFGKGAVQVRLPLDWGKSGVSVTIARVYDPDDRALEGRGVQPHVRVARADEPADRIVDDPVVCAAVEALAARADTP